MSLGRYFFDLKAHVSKNGVVVGIMMEALVGRMFRPTIYYQELIQYRMRHTRRSFRRFRGSR